MTRIADFLGIKVDWDLWPELVEAAQFDAMRRDGATLMSNSASIFREGSDRFFFLGTNNRWRGVVSEEDLALYETKIRQMLEPNCARWIATGRLEAGDPRLR
jgi:aryl sulfotransferase